MATIKIKRKSELFSAARNYKVFIDGHLAGTISNGATKEFPITAGQHTVTVKINWRSSPDVPLNIDAIETKCLIVSGIKHDIWAMLAFIGLIVLFPILRMFLGFGYAILVFLPFFLWPVYYTTKRQKKYLTLKETKDD
jgi:hypothetical protein